MEADTPINKPQGQWKCKSCGYQLMTADPMCPTCHRPTAIPSNVILAAQDEPYLRTRFDDAINQSDETQRALIDNCTELITDHFAVSINMHPHTLLELFQDDRVRYVNMHDFRKAGAVLDYPADAIARRFGIDTLIFGIDGEKLNYGAVNLEGSGTFSYGAACVFLNEELIRDSTSFLENNSFAYHSQSGSSVRLEVPHGVRALWAQAPILGILKHLKCSFAYNKLDSFGNSTPYSLFRR
jgi:hypothetical protein